MQTLTNSLGSIQSPPPIELLLAVGVIFWILEFFYSMRFRRKILKEMEQRVKAPARSASVSTLTTIKPRLLKWTPNKWHAGAQGSWFEISMLENIPMDGVSLYPTHQSFIVHTNDRLLMRDGTWTNYEPLSRPQVYGELPSESYFNTFEDAIVAAERSLSAYAKAS